MLSSIGLKHFKCFRSLQLPLAPLTLLSGSNASGKSSILQALVLLHQTMRSYEWTMRLALNGSCLKLGAVSDVVNDADGGKSLELGIGYRGNELFWRFVGERSELSLAIASVVVNGRNYDNPTDLQFLLPRNESPELMANLKNLTYITAERIGPREIYCVEDAKIVHTVGTMGESAISVFYSRKDETVAEKMCIPEEKRNTLFHQVIAHMRSFFPGCMLAVEKVPYANAVSLRIGMSHSGEFHRPSNVGYGLTQVLPIIIAALSAKTGDILLIENPEVHLHPGAQALMGMFLAKISSAGVQVIFETHSDHVLNGVRRAIKCGAVPCENVYFHYFHSLLDSNEASVTSPQVNDNGDLDFWPAGFFDQFDKDMAFFAGWDQ